MYSASPVFKTPQNEQASRHAYDAALASWSVPHEELDISTSLGSTHVIASGSKELPPLVLLHGSFSSATMWGATVADLSQAFRTYALDTIGDLGKSVPSRLPSSRPEYAQWLLDALDGLGIVQADVAGISYGGFLALNLALAAPSRVHRLVLLSPGVPFAPSGLKWLNCGLPMILFPSRWTVTRAMRLMSVRPYAKDDPVLQQHIVGIVGLRSRVPLRPQFADDELRALTARALLLLGDREIMYDPVAARDRARLLIPGLEAEVIPNAGHMITRDQTQMVNSRILAFLRG